MPEQVISVIPLDPYHHVTGLLVPFVAQRMREMNQRIIASNRLMAKLAK